MTENEFRDALIALIDKARAGKAITLDELTGIIDAELTGLNMALDEGEEW